VNPHQLLRLFPNASQSVLDANKSDYGSGKPENSTPLDSRVAASKPECLPDQALELVHPSQKDVGKRIIVRITCRRVHLQDPDNGLFKPLVDQIRYAKLIPEDDHGTIKLETEQIRVGTRKEEGTEVEIIYP
jgi:hypothetical protein